MASTKPDVEIQVEMKAIRLTSRPIDQAPAGDAEGRIEEAVTASLRGQAPSPPTAHHTMRSGKGSGSWISWYRPS
jgi:hypothetical protein